MRIETAIKLKVTVATAHVGVTSSVRLSSPAIFLGPSVLFFGCLSALLEIENRNCTWNDAFLLWNFVTNDSVMKAMVKRCQI